MLLNRELINKYFNELARLYKKHSHKMHSRFEIVLVGGAAVIEAYNFRYNTQDIDADGHLFEQCIKKVSEKFNLDERWLNDDFKRTSSYTPKIFQYSEYYRTFLNILDIRILSREYLLAMKLKSYRKYKNDLSDIIGIVYEEYKKKPIHINEVKKAAVKLYGSYEFLLEDARCFIESLLLKKEKELLLLFIKYKKKEEQLKKHLKRIGEYTKNLITEVNIDDVIEDINSYLSYQEIIDKLKSK